MFLNRCTLLSHIRSHAFKTATINVSDLKVEPLTLPYEASKTMAKETASEPSPQTSTSPVDPATKKKICCFECQEDINKTGIMYKDRASHYMRYTNEMHTCPVCLFVLPTKCGLEAHIRIHRKVSPIYCPECGIYLTLKGIQYPFNHDCQGFKMMRATCRVKCLIKQCSHFHPSQVNAHMQKHLKKVFKCPSCIVACFNKEAIEKHLTKHPGLDSQNFILFYQCEMCPGRLVVHNQIENHLSKGHTNSFVYPCWECNLTFVDVSELLSHHVNRLCKGKSLDDTSSDVEPKDVLYRVLKRCDNCKVYFTYKCKYDEIGHLPNECPYKCSPGEQVKEVSRAEHKSAETSDQPGQIICHLCRMTIPIDWEDIKAHYAIHHKQFKCLDLKIVLQNLVPDLTKHRLKKKTRSGPLKKKSKPRSKTKKINQTQIISQSNETENMSKLPNEYSCTKCTELFESKKALEEHIISHRDPCSAYQCLECGECFVVKPSFSTHLLIEHGISNAEEYIKIKNCYNESALQTHQNNPKSEEPLRENQCNICRDQFDNQDDLEKHYRVHGMAFLKKSMSKNSP